MFKLENPYALRRGRVAKVIKETENIYTFYIETEEQARPGQYNMLYAFGMGEAPITIASMEGEYLVHTVRAVGDVTRHIDELKEGEILYYRGPYGNTWDIERAHKGELLIISGGLGLAATRWVFEQAKTHHIKRLIHIYGSKDYHSLLYRYLYEHWHSYSEFYITLERPDPRWNGRVGLVTDLLREIELKEDTVVFTCGPDPMVKACVSLLENKGIKVYNIYASLERHMKCSLGTCGHCMIGPYFVCKDGPIFRYDLIREYFERKEV
ncbi:MAG: Ni/Fe hydrogenase subunit gamma [Acidobacteria bacterium]|nr:MAG: Ni/Fe hydrogenase subunit gamma [Acidobacteriota bacterium]